jgi:hypothetical protein
MHGVASDPLPLLEALGAHANAVAASLARGGYCGLREDPATCPVARYLSAYGFADVQVDYPLVSWGNRRRRVLPASVAEFVRRFDAGCYDVLVFPAGPDGG